MDFVHFVKIPKVVFSLLPFFFYILAVFQALRSYFFYILEVHMIAS